MFMKMSAGLFILAIVISPAALSAQAKGESVKPAQTELPLILKRLQTTYAKTDYFSAFFDQTFTSTNEIVKNQGSGRVYFAKPDKIRWEYYKPRSRLFIANGKNLWIYSEDDNQVMQSSKFPNSILSSALAFLQGNGNLEEKFQPVLTSKYETGWTIRLTPKEENPQMTALTLEVSNKSFLVTSAEVEDSLGNRNRFKFEKPAFSQSMQESLFTFTPPKDAEVVPLPEGFLK